VGYAESKGTIWILIVAAVYVAVGITSLWWLPPLSETLHHVIGEGPLRVLWYAVLGIVLVSPILIVVGLQIYAFRKGSPSILRIILAYLATLLCFTSFYTIVSIDGEWHTAEATYELCSEVAQHLEQDTDHWDEGHDHWIAGFLQPDGTYELNSNRDAFAGMRSRVFHLHTEAFSYEIDLADPQLTTEEIRAIADADEHDAVTYHMEHGITRIIDMLYFSVATISTLGYGDIRPTSNVAVAAVVIEVLLGLSLALLGVGVLFSTRQSRLEAREDQLESELQSEREEQETFEDSWD